MNEVTTASIEPAIVTVVCGVCPSCGGFGTFTFRGIQELEEGIPGFSVWNCSSCGSTVSGSRVLPAETESALLAVPHMGRGPQ